MSGNTAEQTRTDRTTSRGIYDRVFWLCYLANFLLVTANALTFRFAEFVRFLGGTERVTGTIVSTGLIATLLVRFRLGQDIDRFGTRRLWLASAALYVLGSLLFVLTHSLTWQIHLARVLYSVGVAGLFTCVMVFIQNHVPPDRRTEAIGTLGTSGFVGMIVGSLLSDQILTRVPPGAIRFEVLFGTTALLGLICWATVAVVASEPEEKPKQITPPVHRLLLAYWPGWVTVGSLMIGVGITVTTVFLTRFCTERQLGGIGLFFTCYSVSAVIFRVTTRHWSHTIGRHRMILLGLLAHAAGHLILTLVREAWQLVLPAVICGFGHAELFPAVVSLGVGRFPRQYRGTATNVMIGFNEVGLVLASPTLGWIIDTFGFTAMFCTTAATFVGAAVLYSLTELWTCDREGVHEELGAPRVAAGRSQAVPSTATESASNPDEEEMPTPFPHTGRVA